ncbi:MAG TPA: FAD-dependent oxidoreductase [Stellaceae bacterium]|nr:FAD-dependent oxidoreductase [Stellaceae bacterium]
MAASPADVIVVGAGLAGHAAAIRAAELGLKPLLLEQGAEPAYLCNSRITIGVFQVALHDMRGGADELRAAIDHATRGYVKAKLRDRYAAEAGPALQWLLGHGIRTINAGAATRNLATLAPPVPRQPGLHWAGRAGDVMLRQLSGKLDALGGKLLRGMRVRELIISDDCCKGVIADSTLGTQRFAAPAVVLADGGFQANPALVKRFISPHPERLLQRNAKSGRGDGLLMAEAAGAALSDMECFYGHVQARDAMDDPELWPYPTIDFPIAAGMAVDRQGKRFTDEGLAGVSVANAIARLDDPLGAVAIFDQAIWEASGKTYVMSANPFLEITGATFHRADTLAALAAKANLPPDALSETVAHYNAAVERHALDRLEPKRSADLGHPWGAKAQPIQVAPFYAVPLCAGITYTMGGVAIDDRARAQHRDGGPIAGLYAAGGTIGGLEGGPVTGYTGGLAKALTFGKLAGESAARQIKGA